MFKPLPSQTIRKKISKNRKMLRLIAPAALQNVRESFASVDKDDDDTGFVSAGVCYPKI